VKQRLDGWRQLTAKQPVTQLSLILRVAQETLTQRPDFKCRSVLYSVVKESRGPLEQFG
jgi:hypothetical protein